MVRVGSEVKANYETLLDALTNEMQALHKELQECKEKLSQEPCEDVISREKALQIIRAWFDREATPSDLKNEIEQLPPVTPQPKMGRWIEENPPMVERYPFCSECGFVNPFENALNYCPNCGCKMQEVEE